MDAIGPYQIRAELARGGMGVVYRCWDPGLRREVAIKVVAAADAVPEDIERFQREVEATARLRHPNIVPSHSAGLVQGRPYLVLDLIDGESLGQRLRGAGRLDPSTAIDLTTRLAQALHYAHGHGVLHRDVKPDNVLIDRTGAPLLTDFGLARIQERRRITLTGEVVGTPTYMAPEQAHGKAEVGPQADVYGLGATLYEMLAGRPPFLGSSLIGVLHQVMTKEPTPLLKLRPEIDPALAEVCHRCLQKSPADRYTSALALAEDLAELGAGGSGSSRSWATAALVSLLCVATLAIGLAVGLRPDAELERERARADALQEKVRELQAKVGSPSPAGSLGEEETPNAQAEAHFQSGEAAILNEDPLTALAEFTKALELAPNVPRAYFRRGVAYQGLGDLDNAIADYTRAIELQPKVAMGFAHRAEACLLKEDWEGALVDAERAIEIEPRAPHGYLVRAQVLSHNGQLVEALADFDQYARFEPRVMTLVYLLRGRIRLKLGHLGPAEQDYARYLEANPNDPAAWADRGAIRNMLGNYQGGLADCAKALELDPKMASAYANRALAHMNRENFGQAMADSRMALELDPSHSAARVNLAWAALKTSKTTVALREANRCIAEHPDYGDAYQLRAEIHMSRHQYLQAEEDLKQAIARFPPGSARARRAEETRRKLRPFLEAVGR